MRIIKKKCKYKIRFVVKFLRIKDKGEIGIFNKISLY